MSELTLPVYLYLPDDPALLELAERLGALHGVERVVLPGPGAVAPSLSDHADLIRWAPGSEPPVKRPELSLLLGAEYTLLERAHLASAYQRAREASPRALGAEALSVEGAVEAAALGATTIVACGFEGPGLVSEETGLVLVRAIRRALPKVRLILRGGIGPDSAAAALAAGADGVVLEHQLWACEEWPVSAPIASRLAAFDPTDTRALGLSLGARYRVFAQIATRPPKDLLKIEEGLSHAALATPAERAAARRELLASIASRLAPSTLKTDLKTQLLPLGQGAALAHALAERYGTVQGVVLAVQRRAASSLELAAARFPLDAGQGAAITNHTALPLHQGPMAQVSDTPAFAKAIVEAGSMPWLALGNMPPEVAESTVWRTGEALGSNPFGAGIIGLDANRYRDAHIEMLGRAVKRFPKMMALVAAGTAEQAMTLEALGVKTYLHTPTPGVLRAALQQGQRLFLLEGTEAGGHIGQLGGLLLWQACILEIERALSKQPDLRPEELTVLPAGGLGDAASAAAVAAMFAPLCERGLRLGVQMGTAYLMTQEAVATGAINEAYQQVGQGALRTVVLGESVGAPTRLLPNHASRQVAQRELDRVVERLSLKERKEAYEHDNLGGLRAAAKAQRIERIDPERGAIFASLTREEQEREGLFHCGQGIQLWPETRSVASLHLEVTEGAKSHLRARLKSLREPVLEPAVTSSLAGAAPADRSPRRGELRGNGLQIAIVGLGAKVPGALSAPAFWQNIERGVSAIKPVPEGRWSAARYFDEDRLAEDKTYSVVGGWVEGFEFDRKAFRLPPTVVKQMDPSQTLWLEAAREALEDAGLLESQSWDRERCAVILGNAMGGDRRDYMTLRMLYPEFEESLGKVLKARGIKDPGLLEAIEREFKAGREPVTEDTMPGELGNVIAGRTAQLFDLGGANFIVDAACASSLAAIEQAVRGLRAGRFDVALTGGVDCCMGPAPFIKFSKIGALSPDGSRPFDAKANGFVMGEGAAAMILKRLEDAERDGDTIYAVIQGIGASSDGKGKAITAPNPTGQRRALHRAYEEAGFSLRSVSLVEAHGTSTPVGDPVEVGALVEVLSESDEALSADYIALGSVKSMIGHLKAAAGAVSVLKVAMALKHATLPPTLNVTELNPALQLDATPIRVQHQSAPWRVRPGAPRRAGVSAFGFGGTNFHIALEAYSAERPERATLDTPSVSSSSSMTSSSSSSQDLSMTPQPAAAHATATTPRAPLAAPRTAEGIIALSASSQPELLSLVVELAAALNRSEVSAQDEALAPYLLDSSRPGLRPPRAEAHALALVFEDRAELPGLLAKAERALRRDKGWRVLANQGVLSRYEVSARGKIAMLFPGQGSQYLGMLAELAERYDVVRETFKEADAIMRPALKRDLSELIHPDLERVNKQKAFIALSQTEITQPAVLTADVALLRLLEAFGVRPDVVAGHSLGEYGACVAAGVMTFKEALHTVALRGTQMANATPLNGDCGLMAAVPRGADEVERELAALNPGYVVCANKNSPTQTIIAGLTEPMQKAMAHFEAQGLQVMQLPVSHAFHSDVVASASGPLREHMGSLQIKLPTTPILTNVTGDHYPKTPDAIRDLLAKQVAAPVEFMAMIERMWAEGARVFVEVGPKRAQASFVDAILGEREHVAIFTNHPKRGAVRSWLEAMATLWLSDAWHGERAVTPSTPEPLAVPGAAATASVSRKEVAAQLLEVLCEKTGYDPEEIETDYELEADLGIDTVKQAEIIAAVRDHHGMARDEDFRLADYPTLDALADYVVSRLAMTAPEMPHASAPTETQDVVANAANAAFSVSREEVAAQLLEVLCEKTGYDPDEIETDYELEADLGIDTVKQAEIIAAVRDHHGMARDEDFRLADYPTLDALADYVVSRLAMTTPVTTQNSASTETQGVVAIATNSMASNVTSSVSRKEVAAQLLEVLCEKTGYDPDEIETDYELEADLGIDTVKQAEIIAAVRDHHGMARDEDFRLADYPTLDALTDYVIARLDMPPSPPPAPPASQPPSEALKLTQEEQVTPGEREIVQHAVAAKIVISGAAVGLPGARELFDEEAVGALLRGENMIATLSEEDRQEQVDQRIVRLVKHESGGGEMVEVTKTDAVIKLAGRPGRLDLIERWGVPERLATALDETSQMAFAAGLEALRDAGLPLVPRYHETRNGGKITIGWQLPESIGATTGVIYASAFTGKDELIDQVRARYTDPDYTFDHRFLLKILGMANARFAEYIGARGPNIHINVACSSTTAAMAMASDWIELGRCERVIVIAADNAAGETLDQWILSGFLAAGAATTEQEVTEAALPFDRRRHGMIVGSGAVGFVLEQGGAPEERGLEPLVDLLGVRLVNSAFHPTRLDVHHLAGQVDAFVSRVERDFSLNRDLIASKLLFVSHETFTPARGGSAAAEIESLRHVFGERCDEVVIANTKGFTGHPMAASLEDGLAVRALQHRQVPPIPNLKQPDEALGTLRLSQGGEYDIDYALRFSAGFGSQFGVSLFRFRSRQDDRLFSEARQRAWLKRISGMEQPTLEVVKRTLRLQEAQPPARDEPRSSSFYTLPEATSSFASSSLSLSPQEVTDAERAEFAPRQVVAAPIELELGSPTAFRDQRVALLMSPSSEVNAAITDACDALGASAVIPLTIEELSDERALKARLQGSDTIVCALAWLHDAGRARALERDPVHAAARGVYHAARAWRQALGETPGSAQRWITLTDMGGRLGLDAERDASTPLHGAVVGATKSLAREWPEASVALVDLEPMHKIVSELIERDLLLGLSAAEAGEIEVGLSAAGEIVSPAGQAIDLERALDAQGSALTEESVILLTGGAKGITAAVARDFAARYRCALVLVGRTAMTFASPLDEDLEAHKQSARERLEARGERATPMALRGALKALESQREVASNMASIRDQGARRVEYVSCDLGDEEAVLALIAQTRERFGRLDLIVHGAGLEISRQLEQKDAEEFDRVFCGKALGALALWRAAAQSSEAHPPADLIFFSSIAGRFGNVGQIDYAAANEVCAKIASASSRGESGRAMVIDWTAWAEVGMAARGSMPEILSSRGVSFLPVELGSTLPARLYEAGVSGEVLVAGSLGELGALRELEQDEAWHKLEGYPLVDAMRRLDERTLEVRRTLSVERDRFMRDHVYEGVPLMPGVIGLELMVEAAQLLTGERCEQLAHVEFERALKLHRHEPLEVVARAVRAEEHEVRLEVLTRRTSKTGREIVQRHYTAIVELDGAAEACFDASPMAIDPSVGRWQRGPERQAIYERFFHRGTFQLIDQIPVLSDEAILGYGRTGSESLVEDLDDALMWSDPLAREAAFQVIGLWGMLRDEVSYLPHRIERDLSLGRIKPEQRFVVRARRADVREEGILRFERVEICDEQGALLHLYEGVEMIGHQKLREEARFGKPHAARWTSLRVCGDELDTWLKAHTIADLIVGEEIKEHDRLISARRRSEWLCARLATKQLAQRWARDYFGASWSLNDFVILKDRFGAPSLAARDGLPSLKALPWITMSHSHGVAYAVISAPGEPAPIGVDIEHIEPREEAFARDYFSPEELALSVTGGVPRDTLITALWCCKESVSKALGLGLKLPMSDILIERFAEDDEPAILAHVTLKREALQALRAQGASALEVRVLIESEFVVALSRAGHAEPGARALTAAQLKDLGALLRHGGRALTERRGAEGAAAIWHH